MLSQEIRDAVDDVWWLDNWNIPPQVADEIPHRRAQLIKAAKSAIEVGRKAAQDDAERNAR